MSLVHYRNNKNNTTYVYESTGYWDKEKQQSRNKRICIGKLNPETGEIIYNKRYLEKQQAVENNKPGPVPSREYKRLFSGTTYLFNQISDQLGIIQDLKKCFPDCYRQILSIAYYLILEDRSPMSRFSRWASTHDHPTDKAIASQRISELFASITEDAKQRFFACQSRRHLEDEYLAYDTTSVSSYSQSMKQVKYGMNKDHDPLAQINLALLFGESTKLPVCYRKLTGNISDVKTIKKLLRDLGDLKPGKVKLVMDRGFYSEANINALYKSHYKFLIAAKMNLKLIRTKLDTVRDDMITRANYSSRHGLYCRSFLADWDYTEIKPRNDETVKEKRRIYVHIYYNDQRATDDKVRFNKLLDRLEEELISNRRNPKNEKLYTKYFSILETPVKGVKLSIKEDAIKSKEKNYGYFSLISNGVKDPLEAIDIYRSKDIIEKAFGDLKSRLNLRRTSVSSEESLEGKLFVQYVGLIIISFIKNKMDEADLFKKYTVQGVLDELDVIECFQQPGTKRTFGEVSKRQQDLYHQLGVNIIS